MEINISLKADKNTVSKLAEESESNESVFVKKFCTEILQKIADETKKLCEAAKEINIENPYGFPAL